jgi:putative ABC transport system permease protein
MKAILVKAVADIRRRRLQSAVVLVIVLLASLTGTIALTLTSQTRDPYQRAFDAQKGAHLQVFYDGKVDPSLLTATPRLIGAASSGGPYPGVIVAFAKGDQKYQLAAIGRADPGGDVGVLKVVAGHWPTSDREIALTRSFSELRKISIGDRLVDVNVPDKPVLTVVAQVVDIDEGEAQLSSQNAWVLPSAIPTLGNRADSDYHMDYRFAGDPGSDQLKSYTDRLQSALPPGSIDGSVTYLLFRSVFNITNTILTSVLLAFSVFALIAAAAIVGNLVTGIVISSQREIGIMKSIGFTPAQVVGVFVLQAVVPALAGCLVGIPAGTLLSQPLLANSSHALGLAYEPTFSIPIDLLALLGVLAVVALAASLPALRAGLLKPARVLSGASAPSGSGGTWVRRQAARLRLSRPVGLGAGEAFARPVRGALTVLAVLIGVATILVGLGLPQSFERLQGSETGVGSYQVVVSRTPAYPDSGLMAALAARPETQRVVAEAYGHILVPGVGDATSVNLFRGDSSRLGFMLVRGRWFDKPGEVVVPKGLLQDAHLAVGDTFTGSAEGKQVPLRVVGEVYDISNLGHSIFTDLATYPLTQPAHLPTSYLVTLRPGSDVDGYIRRLVAIDPDFIDAQANRQPTIGPVQIITSVLLALALVLSVIAAAGVFNTILLNTRERIRDTATLKAIGMTPKQVLVMVATSAAVLALIGGLAAVPIGVALERILLDLISSAAGNDTPPAVYGGLGAITLIGVPLGAVVVAVAAALLPGRWAAATNVAAVLHSEYTGAGAAGGGRSGRRPTARGKLARETGSGGLPPRQRSRPGPWRRRSPPRPGPCSPSRRTR